MTSKHEAFIQTVKPQLLARLDTLTQFSLTDPRQQLALAMRYTLLAPSKCFRGLLLCATHSLISTDLDAILPIACALEMMHSASLIYDDLPCMDDGTVRRGNPSSHCVFGEDTAILAGYTLQSYAYDIISRPSAFAPANQLAAIHWFGHACGVHGIAGGQYLDLVQSKTSIPIAPVSQIHALKTGALIEACVYIPALLHGHPNQHALKTIGQSLGLLFQMTDDILDQTSTTAQLGKQAQQDSTKKTYISDSTLAVAKEKAAKLAQDTCDGLRDLGYDDSLLTGFIHWAHDRIS